MPDNKQPKLQGYCAALYEAMINTSTVEENQVLVWRGKLVELANSVGIPPGTYRRVMEQLESLKCIEQVERGFRGSQLTTVILYQAPTPDVWDAPQPLTNLTRPAMMWARLENVEKDIERRLGKLDLIKALGEMQQQLDSNTEKLNELIQKQNKES